MRIQGIDSVLIPLPGGMFLRSQEHVKSIIPSDDPGVTQYFVHYAIGGSLQITEAEFNRLAAEVERTGTEGLQLIPRDELFEIGVELSRLAVSTTSAKMPPAFAAYLDSHGYAIVRTEAK